MAETNIIFNEIVNDYKEALLDTFSTAGHFELNEKM